MIDEYWTWEFYGYYSDELTHASNKSIVARCDECCKYRVLRMQSYRDLCIACVKIGRQYTEEEILNMSRAGRCKPNRGEDWRNKISETKLSQKRNHTTKSKRLMSAVKQHIDIEDWSGFIKDREYCEKFDEACKERVREKYNRLCFICDKNENDNGRKLDVHHVDRDKTQGCDDVEWKLVPLCRSCHGHAHSKIWQARIEYIITTDCA